MYYVWLVLFGILGALSRYSLQLMIHTGSFPLATLIINLTGCFLLAFVTQFLIWMPRLSAKMVSAIGTGFVGSFTTFSTFALESSRLIQAGDYLAAVGYVLLSGIGGFIACAMGYRASKVLLVRRKRSLRHAD
ncbi:fluoride efflux transporter CrcB [Sporolactobacillus sp. THM7-7]|nr:fluoride efflux transporter CrcB [Sporolactobacillus sp. THM7-7]